MTPLAASLPIPILKAGPSPSPTRDQIAKTVVPVGRRLAERIGHLDHLSGAVIDIGRGLAGGVRVSQRQVVRIDFEPSRRRPFTSIGDADEPVFGVPGVGARPIGYEATVGVIGERLDPGSGLLVDGVVGEPGRARGLFEIRYVAGRVEGVAVGAQCRRNGAAQPVIVVVAKRPALQQTSGGCLLA
jgi:hypothetical protein